MKYPFLGPAHLTSAQSVIIAQRAGIVKIGIAAAVSAVGIGYRDLIRTQVADDSNDGGEKLSEDMFSSVALKLNSPVRLL